MQLSCLLVLLPCLFPFRSPSRAPSQLAAVAVAAMAIAVAVALLRSLLWFGSTELSDTPVGFRVVLQLSSRALPLLATVALLLLQARLGTRPNPSTVYPMLLVHPAAVPAAEENGKPCTSATSYWPYFCSRPCVLLGKV